jgi:hypothetical protein
MADDEDEYDDEEGPKSRTGRFQVLHRGGTRVEVGEPIFIGPGKKPWLCAVKLVGQKRDDTNEPEPTQTLLVRTGRGDSPEEAQREAMAQLTVVYGSPVNPPPHAVISSKSSAPPPSDDDDPPKPPARPSFIDRLKDMFKK